MTREAWPKAGARAWDGSGRRAGSRAKLKRAHSPRAASGAEGSEGRGEGSGTRTEGGDTRGINFSRGPKSVYEGLIEGGKGEKSFFFSV